MTTSTDTNRDLVTVVATLKAKAGKEDELRAGLSALVEPTRSEDGNISYDLHESRDQPGLFYFVESWESSEALGKHLQSPALQQALAGASELLDGPPVISRLKQIA